MKFQTELPPVINFGRGIRFRLPELLPDGRVVVICGRHSEERIRTEIIPRLRPGVEAEIFGGFPAEVPLDAVSEVRDMVRRVSATAVVGWGGGSAIDGAKAVAVLANFPGSVEEAFYGRGKPVGREIFFAAVPTTAGTGAEITPNAVLCDPATGIKQSLRAPGMTADVALVDPELAAEAPPSVFAASAFDALTQALESFISRRADALSRLLARAAADELWSGLSAIAADGGRRTDAAVDRIVHGSMLAGSAFVSSGLGAVHGIAHPVGGRRHVPHGIACAVLLTAVLRRNLGAATPQLRELALLLCGNDDPERLIEAIAIRRRQFGLPADFREYGLTEQDIPFIVANCRSGSMKSNPCDLSDDEVAEIVRELI